MREYRTRTVSPDTMLAELNAFCSESVSLGHAHLALRFGWDSDVEFHELWKPHQLPISEALARIKEADEQGIVKLGESDILLSVSGVELTLCHESDLHLKGEGALFDVIATRWQRGGLEPSEVKPSSFKWPDKD